MYPSLVTTTTTCSLGIILVVSTFISSNSSLISVLLGIPYSFFIFLKSSLITELSLSGLVRISSYNLIFSSNFFISSSSRTTSVLVSLYNCKLTIASACLSVKLYSLTKFTMASALFLLLLIRAITSSNIDIAFTKPSIM